MYICVRRLGTLVVPCSITMKSPAANSTVLVNYSKILPLKYSEIDGFYEYI